MWNDDNDKIMEISSSVVKGDAFPKKCPICGSLDAHIFFYKKGDSNLGSMWEWCSKCKNYSHSRYLIPAWWENADFIESEKLEGEPDVLDSNKDDIDQYVNNLLSK